MSGGMPDSHAGMNRSRQKDDAQQAKTDQRERARPCRVLHVESSGSILIIFSCLHTLLECRDAIDRLRSAQDDRRLVLNTCRERLRRADQSPDGIHPYWLLSSRNGLGEMNRPDWAWRRIASSAGSAATDIVGGAFPPPAGAPAFDEELFGQVGSCGDRGIGGIVSGPEYGAGAAALLFPANAPAPTGTGAGVSGMAGILTSCGAAIPGPAAGLYNG